MSSSVTIKALGLYTQPNKVSLPPGALVEATNVVIRRDNVIEPTRGFNFYGNSFGTDTDRAKQVAFYKNRLLRHYSNIIQFDSDGSGTFSNFTGNFTEPTTGIRIKHTEQNGNFYFTTSNGVYKISASDASQLGNTSNPVPAGGVKAIDVKADINTTLGNQSGFMSQDSAAAYRVVWATKDANQNLIQGTPSQRVQVYNSLLTLLLEDYSRFLRALDLINSSLISNDNYLSTYNLPITAAATQLQTNLISTATAIDNDLLYANDTGTGAPLTISAFSINSQIATVTFSAGDPRNYWSVGSRIYLTGFATIGGYNPNGFQTIASLNATTITFNTPVFQPININSNSVANPTVVTTSLAHNLATGNTADIESVVGSAPAINGIQTVTVTSSTTFTVPVNVTTGGTGGTVTFISGSAASVTGTSINSYEYRYIVNNGDANFPTSLVASTIDTPATHQELLLIQDTLKRIIIRVQSEPNATISSALQSAYISPLELTTSANVKVTFTIPAGITTDYFYDVYRSDVVEALQTQSLLTDVVPSDELSLVYEKFVTTTDLSAGTISFIDTTPDAFKGAFLYTNASTGEGISQANDVPPLCQDINQFKNYLFFANTQTRQRLSINLLGVTNMINNYNSNTPPKITITDGTTINTYAFTLGTKQVTSVTLTAGNTYNTSGTSNYFEIYSANNQQLYYVWFQQGTSTDPAISNAIGIRVNTSSGQTATQVATDTRNAINQFIQDFTATNLNAVITITNVNVGITTHADTLTHSMPVSFSISTTTSGDGEDASNKKVLLANLASVSQSIDATANSLVRVVNQNSSEIVYLYYTSGATTLPGQMLMESRTLTPNPIYIVAESSITGGSFNPDISPDFTITNTLANPTVVTTSGTNNYNTGDKVIIFNNNGTPALYGTYTITKISGTTFSVPVNVTVAGTSGVVIALKNAEVTQNEVAPNRIYYSKVSQPEAVPTVNFLDIGAKNKAILRIFPLRDSLFVFKEDGLFRISGETDPFNVALFDLSCILLAPDSLDAVNNLLYGWTVQGIQSVNEAGASIISRPIDTVILPTGTSNFPNFKTATWAVGYNADNAYYVFTCSSTSDTLATICYRYSTLTNSWTTLARTATCGVVSPSNTDDKLYIGAGDVNFTESERKTFSRLDYCNRQYTDTLSTGQYFGNQLKVSDVAKYSIGDVLTQDQTLGIFEFNTFLRKLDVDSKLTYKNYYNNLKAIPGDNLSIDLDAVITQIANDAGRQSYAGATSAATYTALTPTGSTFAQLASNYQALIVLLNADNGLGFHNYSYLNDTTTQEVIVTNVNVLSNTITVNLALDFIQGPTTLFKSFSTSFTYAPQTMGDPLFLKHLREMTVIFETRAFSSANINFSSDLIPVFQMIPFTFDGPGLFGLSGSSMGFGSGYFGGASNSAPLRTYIPRNYQRCRYLNIQFQHNVAREFWSILGTTITGEVQQSTRAYR